MGGGDWQPVTGREQQPGAGSQQRSQHAIDQDIGSIDQQRSVHHAFPDGRGDFAAGQEGAGKFKDGGDNDGGSKFQCPGTNRGCHGIGDVISTNAPGHEQAKQGGEYQVGRAVFHWMIKDVRLYLFCQHQLQPVARAEGSVCQVSGPVYDLVHEDNVDRRQVTLKFV